MDLAPALNIIKQFEGCKLKAYQDIVGVWTIGFGSTANVSPGEVITIDEALKRLNDDVAVRANKVQKLVTADCTNNQLCALVSLSYNIGLGNLTHSTLLKLLNERADVHQVADEFLKWDKAGGQVVAGLLRRRQAERSLFLS